MRQPCMGLERRLFGLGPLEPALEVFGVASRDLVEFAAFTELLERIGPRALEQPTTRLGAMYVRLKQRFCDQFQHPIADLAFVARIANHRSGRLQREAAGEDGKASHDHALTLRQQRMAPVERRAQRLVTRRCRPTTVREQTEAAIEPRSDAANTKPCGAGSRKLYGKRDAVEVPTYRRRRGDGACVERKTRLGRQRARDKELYGTSSDRPRTIRRANALVRAYQALDAADEARPRSCAQELGDITTGLVEIFGHTVGSVVLSLDLQPLPLAGEARRALLLAASELVINAMRHAFIDRPTGVIQIRLEHDRLRQEGVLVVADDGVGPGGLAKGRGQGCSIIHGLADLLDGDVVWRRSLLLGGTEVELSFPLPSPVIEKGSGSGYVRKAVTRSTGLVTASFTSGLADDTRYEIGRARVTSSL